VQDWVYFVAIVAVPFASYVFGVWVASEAERRAFRRLVGSFDEVTRDHRRATPKIRMTLYRKFIDKTCEGTQRLLTREPLTSKEIHDALEHRRRVFLRVRAPEDGGQTLRMHSDEQITQRMEKMRH
jgi:hypothetical protein